MGRGGRTVARLIDDGTSVDVIYSHQDHLGSAASATDASGNLLWREDYTPFGETRQNPAANDNDEAFTGHIMDTATGLTYMQARYYDPVIGRFLSNDPVGFASGGWKHFNRYAYAENDPVSRVDPNGEDSFLVTRPILGGRARHAFVVVTDGEAVTDTQVARFSFGPSGPRGTGELVNVQDGIDPSNTNRDDAAAMTRLRNGDNAGLTVTPIPADDATVIAVGNAAIGHPDYDGPSGAFGPPDGANSNSAGVAIASRSAGLDGNIFTLPQELANQMPGHGEAGAVLFDEAAISAHLRDREEPSTGRGRPTRD